MTLCAWVRGLAERLIVITSHTHCDDNNIIPVRRAGVVNASADVGKMGVFVFWGQQHW